MNPDWFIPLSNIDRNLSKGATTSGFDKDVPDPSPTNAIVGPVTNPPDARPGIPNEPPNIFLKLNPAPNPNAFIKTDNIAACATALIN